MSESGTNDKAIIENDGHDVKTKSQQKKKDRRKNKEGPNESTNIASLQETATNSDNNSQATAGPSTSSSTVATSKPSAPIYETVDEAQNRALLEQLKLNPNLLPILRTAKTPEEALQKPYKFWSTQPVPKFDEKIEKSEAIEPNKSISELRAEPYALPPGFKWETLNINDPLVLTELYTLLNENYVEDDDAMFRFDYQPNFLKWALQPPGWLPEWHIGVRVVKSGLLVGFISAIPGHVRIYEKTEKIVEINFLCVHKKLRSKRVAPVLIREVTRRVNLTGIFQAVYTAGVVLPKPIATCRYWHRSLNPKKLIQVSKPCLVVLIDNRFHRHSRFLCTTTRILFKFAGNIY